MRKVETGIAKCHEERNLILSLPKDAGCHCRKGRRMPMANLMSPLTLG
jgi:hypothetical protein